MLPVVMAVASDVVMHVSNKKRKRVRDLPSIATTIRRHNQTVKY